MIADTADVTCATSILALWLHERCTVRPTSFFLSTRLKLRSNCFQTKFLCAVDPICGIFGVNVGNYTIHGDTSVVFFFQVVSVLLMTGSEVTLNILLTSAIEARASPLACLASQQLANRTLCSPDQVTVS